MPDTMVSQSSGQAAAPKTGDGWQRVTAILAALNPVTLLVMGWFLNSSIEQAKLKLAENSTKLADLKTSAETATIVLGQRVDKVAVIRDFLNDLSGPDERRRRLAIEAIFIALPDEAARLVKAVEEVSGSDAVRGRDVAAAKDALASTRDRLVTAMFSDARPVRVEALNTLKRGWADDPEIIRLLVARAMQDVRSRKAAGWDKPADRQRASIYNVMEFLTYARVPWDGALGTAVREFADAAADNSDDTQDRAAVVREQLQRARSGPR